MKGIIKQWLSKLVCCHEWEILKVTSYTTHDRCLMVCKKCRKVKRVNV